MGAWQGPAERFLFGTLKARISARASQIRRPSFRITAAGRRYCPKSQLSLSPDKGTNVWKCGIAVLYTIISNSLRRSPAGGRPWSKIAIK